MSHQRTLDLRLALRLRLLLIGIVVAVLGWQASPWSGRHETAPDTPPVAAAQPPAAPATPVPEPAPPATVPAVDEIPAAVADAPSGRTRIDRPITDLDPETRAALEARLERERAARARFEEGIERSQVRARDIDTRLKEALRRVELEPVLVEGGMMRGLRIRTLEGGSALYEAGFRSGDLLVQIGGRPLDDPAELPDVLASAGPDLAICALRGGAELCRELSLR